METIAEEKKLEGEIRGPPKSENILSKLNKGFRRSKAEQILRLLKDQEELNNKLKEYSLVDGSEANEDRGNDSDNWSLAGSDTSSVKETETRPVKKMLRKQKSGRSKTSMGFHLDDLSDLSSDSEADDRHLKVESKVLITKLTRHQSMNVKSRPRDNFEDYNNDVKGVDYDVASVKSSRPKSSIASFSARNRRPHLLCDPTIHIPQSPRGDDSEVNKQRKRISNVKVDPLFRRTGVHCFGDPGDRRDSIKSELSNIPTPSNITPRLSTPRKIVPSDLGALDKTTSLSYDQGRSLQSRPVARSTSFAERGKYAERASRSSRNVLSVDSHPLQTPPDTLQSHSGIRRPSPLQASSGEPPQGPGGTRRPKSGPRNARKYGDVTKSSGRTSLNVISERTQPVAVMKLPPLDSSLKKAVPERDLICYGKEAMV